MAQRLAHHVVWLCLMLLVGSCEWVADIPERSLVTEPCQRFCDLALQLCTGEFAIYHNTDCESACALYSTEERQCREGELNKLKNSSQSEAYLYCPNASLSGGSKVCGGSRCKNYCETMSKVCSDDREMGVTYPQTADAASADCEQKCEILTDREQMLRSGSTFDIEADHYGDTLQCRFVHLTLASVSADYAKDHCWHAFIAPRPRNNMASPCATPHEANGVPRCEDYCAVIMRTCTDDGDQKHAVYESTAQCRAACEAFPKGNDADQGNANTLACRHAHAYNAGVFADPATHCPHAGPGGAGVCGDDCEGYCSLLKAGCPAQFDSEHGGSMEACQKACDSARKADPNNDDGKSYSIAKAKSGDPVACRLYHAALANSLGSDAQDTCMIAAGLKDCPF